MILRLLGLALLAAVLTACGQQAPTPERDPAPAPGAQAVASEGGFDATARAFVELVIPTDEQAVALLDLGAKRASDPRLRTYATALAGARRTELTELRKILAGQRIRYVNYHSGHDMPGMPTEAELVACEAAPDFDTEFVRLVRAHLTESATVASSGASAVKHPATLVAAQQMVQERAEALKSLDALG